jgi:nuclear pore complex protein Nup54
MSGVRERARILQEETEKMGKSIESQQNGELLSEDDQKALEKVCFCDCSDKRTLANLML